MQHKNNPPTAHRFALIFQQICQTGSKQVSILEDEGHDDSILVDQVKTSREINVRQIRVLVQNRKDMSI